MSVSSQETKTKGEEGKYQAPRPLNQHCRECGRPLFLCSWLWFAQELSCICVIRFHLYKEINEVGAQIKTWALVKQLEHE